MEISLIFVSCNSTVLWSQLHITAVSFMRVQVGPLMRLYKVQHYVYMASSYDSWCLCMRTFLFTTELFSAIACAEALLCLLNR